jgi:hypothetical protein
MTAVVTSKADAPRMMSMTTMLLMRMKMIRVVVVALGVYSEKVPKRARGVR